MKIKALLVLILIFAFGSLYSAQAQANRQVNVQVRQTKRIPRTNLLIKFVSFIEDSRCPTDVNCITAGNAKIRVRISNSRGAVKFVELNTNLKPQSVVFSGYEIKLVDLNPKPRTNIRINPNRYTATFSVRRL